MTGTRKNFIVNVLVALLFTGIGIGLLVGGAMMKSKNDQLINEWPHVEGVVVDYVTRNDDDGLMYREIVEFKADGRDYRITSSSSSNIRPTIGEVKEVAYNPQNPQDGIILSDNSLSNILMFVVGGVFTAVAPLMVISALMNRRKQQKAQSEELPPAIDMQTGGESFPRTDELPVFPAQSVPPSDEQPFKEFDTKDRR